MATTADLLRTAVQHIDSKRFDDAEALARQVLASEPKNVGALHVLGVVARATGRTGLAVDSLRAAIALDGRHAGLHFELAAALEKAQQVDAAIAEYRRAIEIWPEYQEAHLNAGALLDRVDRHAEALVHCEAAVRLKPDCPLARFNLGNVQRALANFAAAIEAFDGAIAIEPKFAQAYWNRSCCHLLQGNLTQGWQDYRWRQPAGEVVLDKYTQPLWRGEDLRGKSILVHAEQGLGDEILFASCLPDLIAQAGRCVVVCEPRLQALLARSFPSAQVIGYARRKDAAPAAVSGPIDFQVPAGSVPLFVRPTLASFPSRQRFLLADPAKRRTWQQRYEALGPGLKVGISWRAGGQPVDRRRRTTLLAQWQELFRQSGVHFVNLQYGDCVQELAAARTELGVEIHDWPDADPLVDLDGFAAKLAALDLVISVGNATVHLAGALGKPTWAILPYVPGWRWGMHGSSSPWYPSVQLHRQVVARDWSPVFAEIAKKLSEWTQTSAESAPPTVPTLETVEQRGMVVTKSVQATTAPQNKQSKMIVVGAAKPAVESELPAISRLSDLPPICAEAAAAFETGDMPRAETLAQQVLDHAPRDAWALQLMAAIGRSTGRFDLTVRSLQRLLVTAPQDASIHLALADAYAAAGQNAEAIASYQAAIQFSTELTPAHVGLANALKATGDLTAAVASFARALELSPDSEKIHSALGGVYFEQNDLAAAAAAFRRAVEINPAYAAGYNNLGQTLQRQGNWPAAIECYERATEIDGTFFQAVFSLAGAMAHQHQCSKAESYFRRALELRPGNPAVLAGLGRALQHRRKFTEAIDSFDAALAADPNLPGIHADRELSRLQLSSEAEACASGPQAQSCPHAAKKPPATMQDLIAAAVQHSNEGRNDEARTVALQIVQCDPTSLLGLRILSICERRAQKPDEAIELLRKAIKHHPNHFLLHFDLGCTLNEKYQQQEAYAEFLKTYELNPKFQPALINLGGVLEQQERYEESLVWIRKALEIKPDCHLSLYNMANSLRETGDVEQAVKFYQRALDVQPTYARAAWNMAICYLHLGDFKNGWPLFENRVAAEEVMIDKHQQPRWDGSPLAGKSIVVHAEQGVGDEILFASCFAEVIKQAQRTTLICDPRLQRLFARSFPQATVVGHIRRNDWAPPALGEDFDYQIPAGSLPGLLRPTADSFPKSQGFLQADPQQIAEWKQRFAQLGPGLKIGISWRAGGKPLERRKRTIALEHWREIFAVPGTHFINLQYSDSMQDLEDARETLGVTIHDWEQGDPLVDLDGFAAKLAALDLVISVGNATVHMAGSLGTPAWTLLPMVPSWRWMVRGQQSLWYSSVRLFRQAQRDQWQPVLQQISSMLVELAESKGKKTPANVEGRKPSKQTGKQARQQKAREAAWLDPTEFAAQLSVESITANYEQARQQQLRGELETAERGFRQILQVAPRHLKSLQGLGVIARQTGRLELAVRSLQRAVAMVEAYAPTQCDLGGALCDSGRLDEAEVCLERAIQLDPKLAAAYVELGVVCQRRGQHGPAIEMFRKAVALPNHDANLFLHWGRSLAATCQVDKAIRSYEQALRLQPNFAAAQVALGEIYLEDQRYEEAESCFRGAIAQYPEQASNRTGKPIDKHLLTAHSQLGRTLELLGRSSEARTACQQAIELDPCCAPALVQLACAEREVGHSREALQLLRRAIAADLQRADLHTLLGNWLQGEGELASSIEAHDAALAIEPELATAHAQRGLALLQWGNYAEGWQEYEWRWKCPHTRPRNFFAQPEWDGSPLAGKTILVHAEQGVGDELMFGSCYTDLVDSAKQVVITCEPRLERLWQQSFPEARVFAVPRGREHLWQMPADLAIDCQIAAGSLPRYLRSTHADFPRPDHYLAADPLLVERWSERFASLGPGLKVGISWRAGETPHDQLRRSAELQLWQPLLEMAGVHPINLQYGDCTAEIASVAKTTGAKVHHWQDADNLRDLDGLAARIASVDVVVSVGNTTVHLAGSLGVPTFCLLPQAGGWRWLAGETESPWYRSVRLYRQCRMGDWPELFARVRQDLLTRQKRTVEVPKMRTVGRPHWNQATTKTREV